MTDAVDTPPPQERDPLYGKLDDYLLGKLTVEDHLKFEALMREDPLLAEEVRVRRDASTLALHMLLDSKNGPRRHKGRPKGRGPW